MSRHHVVLGLARPRTPWFAEVGRWATSGSAPIEFVRCLTAEEVRVRLRSGRAYSALLVDAGCPGFDRDLLEAVGDAGAAVVAVDDPEGRGTHGLPVAARLPHGFGRVELLDVLSSCAPHLLELASPTGGGEITAVDAGGELIAVTGPGGTGSSVLAMALAQSLGTRRPAQPSGNGVLLADLSLHADLAMLHAAPDIIPGLADLVDAHRHRTPEEGAVREHAFEVVGRGYDLLLGLRRHREWAALRPRAVEATIGSLRRTYPVVVADVDADVEGERECGAVEVEERNVLARTVCAAADLVLVVGLPELKGVHALARTIDSLVGFGVDPSVVVPVVNRAPRHPRRRAEISAALAALAPASAAGTHRGGISGALFVPPQRRVELALRDGTALPAKLGTPLARAAERLLARSLADRDDRQPPNAPERIAPGSLGRFTTDRAAS